MLAQVSQATFIRDHVVPRIPPHAAFVEMFGTGPQTAILTPPSPLDVYNDADGELLAFTDVLGDEAAFARFRWYAEAKSSTWSVLEGEGVEPPPLLTALRWYGLALEAVAVGRETPGWYETPPTHRWDASPFAPFGLEPVLNRLRLLQVDALPAGKLVTAYEAPTCCLYADFLGSPLDPKDTLALMEALYQTPAMVVVVCPTLLGEMFESHGWERGDVPRRVRPVRETEAFGKGEIPAEWWSLCRNRAAVEAVPEAMALPMWDAAADEDGAPDEEEAYA